MIPQFLGKGLEHLNQRLDEELIRLTMEKDGCTRRLAKARVEREVREIVGQQLSLARAGGNYGKRVV
jgi:hypothetical protein